MLLRRAGKEPLSGGHITMFSHEKVDGPTLLIDGAIEIDPLAFDFARCVESTQILLTSEQLDPQVINASPVSAGSRQ
jgi:hypothetical protein